MSIWLIAGIVFTAAAIYLFREDGTTQNKYELYYALAGVALGPITAVLIAVDMLKRQMNGHRD